MRRRDFLRYAFGTAVVSGCALHSGRSSEGGGKRRPNIVLIMADDLGYEALGCYGGTSYSTPNLDRLSENGIRFEECHSTPKCCPSRVKILTGRYGFRNYIGWGKIPEDEITFGTVLKSARYATALAGKWQLCLLKDNPDHVHEKGFDEYSCWGWHEGPRYWKPLIWQNGRIRKDIEDRYGPDVFTEFLIDFIKRHKNQRFLAYYPMCLTHFPKSHEPKGPDGDWETFAEMVSLMDKEVGKIVDALNELGLRRDTLILFTGDNGCPGRVTSKLGGKPVRGGKGRHIDTGTHVPLIANWQGVCPEGTVCGDLIDFSDFMPTFAELAGAKLPEGVKIDGRSFAGRLKGKKGAPRAWIYNQWKGKSYVRTKRRKLYRSGKLFDLKNDLAEKKPILPEQDTSKTKAVRRRLERVLAGLKKKEPAGRS